MKFLVLAAFVALACAKHLPNDGNKLVDLITRHGYPTETSTVTTQDGYILQLVRIPYGLEAPKRAVRRPAVLLLHGFMSSAEDFVYGGPTQSLAFHLADHGYDVYLANARGSPYGQQHTTLSPTKDAAFWRYCFDQIGQKDLPAIVDRVLAISQQQKITFVGHAEGATAFLILVAEQPEYGRKFERAVALGPIAYMRGASHPILEKIASNHNSKSWVMKNLGTNAFRPSPELVASFQMQCQQVQPDHQQEICDNVFFLFNGYNSLNFNQTTLREVVPRVPAGGSVREVLHYAQLAASGRFESFEYDPMRTMKSHEYDLSQINVPVAVYYTPNDVLAAESDIETLISHIPDVFEQKLYNSYTNNLDLLYGKNVIEVYNDVLAMLRKERKETRL